ncbi:ornithine carbamoyltransferase [Planctobacterium marinum]|uniref:ornithine carbamoyltransferase n=1 Tax=Planctobacterium marinum TaxID=1631968 RepID=UPI001E5BFF39|nr:ornithine carbamoyltransferase [Planctobacterium marinum]MCC2607613.1 ornithine carbamoyltransferase [Planctobacterium marinum]
MKQDLLTFTNWSKDNLQALLDSALDIKAHPEKYATALAGKSIVGLFEKPSLRTRVSFDIGINKLGGHFLYLDMESGNLSGRESGKDMAGNLGCWADAIVARVFKHSTLQTLSENTHVPVINALCDLYHPCQALADYLALAEKFDDLSSVHLAYLGDGNNVAHSLMIVGAILGVKLTIATPMGYEPDSSIVDWCQSAAQSSGSTLTLTNDVNSLKDVDALYTDTWISMGDSTPLEQIKNQFQPFQLNETLMKQSGAQWAMHCQPAHRDLEITSKVADSEQSLLLLQAENRMHAQNAILLWLLAKN